MFSVEKLDRKWRAYLVVTNYLQAPPPLQRPARAAAAARARRALAVPPVRTASLVSTETRVERDTQAATASTCHLRPSDTTPVRSAQSRRPDHREPRAPRDPEDLPEDPERPVDQETLTETDHQERRA